VEAPAEDEACGNPVCRQPRPAGGWSRLPRQLGGGYTLLMGMGRGHWGAVYVARSAEGEEVAARVCYLAGRRPDAARLFNQRCERERSYQRFLSDYDDIVQPLDSGKGAEGVPYLIMELVRGNTLERVLGRPQGGGDMINRTRKGALATSRAILLMRRMCVALGHLHHHKLVHGQLKPSNVFVLNSPGGEAVKLGDMGLARLLAGSSRGARSRLGPDQVSPASAPYMSPEQVRGAAQLSPCSDVYSLGVITYEMLTGRLPLQISDRIHGAPDRQEGVDLSATRWGRFASGWLKAHLIADPVPLTEVRPDLPPALEGLLEDCLVRDPGDRLRDTDAVIMQLAMVEQELARGPARAPAPVVKPPMVEDLDDLKGVPLPDPPRRPTGPLPSPASLGKGPPGASIAAPVAPAAAPVAPAPVGPAPKGANKLFGTPANGGPAGGPNAMELAMERDKLAMEVARLRREASHLASENQQLRQRLEALQAAQTQEQQAPRRQTGPRQPAARAPDRSAAAVEAAKTQERAPVGDDEDDSGRDRVTRILGPGMVPAEIAAAAAAPKPPKPRAQKVPYGGELDDLSTTIAPSRLLGELAESSEMEDFVNLDTAATAGEVPDDQLLEDQPTNILESEVGLGGGLGDGLSMAAEMTNVIPQDEIFVDVDGASPVVDDDATREHQLHPMATTVDGTHFDDEEE